MLNCIAGGISKAHSEEARRLIVGAIRSWIQQTHDRTADKLKSDERKFKMMMCMDLTSLSC